MGVSYALLRHGRPALHGDEGLPLEAGHGPRALVHAPVRQPAVHGLQQRPDGVVPVRPQVLGDARPDVHDVGDRGPAGRLGADEGDAEDRLLQQHLQLGGDELLLLPEEDLARLAAAVLQHARGHLGEDAREHGVAVGEAADAGGLHEEALALHVLLVDEGALPPHAAGRVEPRGAVPAEVLQVAGLAPREERPAAPGLLGVVDVDLPVAAVHGPLHEGLADALAVDDDVVLVLLDHGLAAALARALHEEGRGHAVLPEPPEQPAAVLHLDEQPHVVQRQGPGTARALRDLQQAALGRALEKLGPEHQQGVAGDLRRLAVGHEVLVRAELHVDAGLPEARQQRPDALHRGRGAVDEEPRQRRLAIPPVAGAEVGR
mmetsp:Transcript_75803/g.245417  ORF Transcript_75803/g.245417 Transcript_75803/m.245417 type:complete len:375 (-) Transcript_75803:183-1307(-)